MGNEMRLIDANALMKKIEDRINDLITEYGQYDSYVNGLEEGLMAVEDAPTVDAVPVMHGRWKNGDPYCPICGKDKFRGLDADVWADWQPDYCPNCGARMDGGEKRWMITFAEMKQWKLSKGQAETMQRRG